MRLFFPERHLYQCDDCRRRFLLLPVPHTERTLPKQDPT
jgi:hypothetical protein